MADEKSTCPGAAGFLTTHDEDERDQRALFSWVLGFHPKITYTRRELLLELGGGGSPGYLSADAGERALRELVGAGLLHPIGEDEMVRPTRAAVRYFELTDGAF
jgi:hypothetical protein